jgi:hypothetical protein
MYCGTESGGRPDISKVSADVKRIPDDERRMDALVRHPQVFVDGWRN